jgi:hypothetical protein
MVNKMVIFYFTLLALVAVGSSSPLDLGNVVKKSELLNPVKNVLPLPSLVRNARSHYPHYDHHYNPYHYQPYYGGGYSNSNAHATASAGSGSGGYGYGK